MNELVENRLFPYLEVVRGNDISKAVSSEGTASDTDSHGESREGVEEWFHERECMVSRCFVTDGFWGGVPMTGRPEGRGSFLVASEADPVLPPAIELPRS